MHSEEAKIYIALLIAAGILALILVLFIVSTLRQQKKLQQLFKEKINAEIKTLENERRRVARDLHDEVAVLLSVAKLELSSITDTDKRTNVLLHKASDHIEKGLTQIREIAKDLMPVALERKGLVIALEEFLSTVGEAYKLNIEYYPPNSSLNLPGEVQVHIYRIVQEIVYNSLKHACASLIKFGLRNEGSNLHIYLEDNGKGFNQANVINGHTGLGLHNIFSRVEMLNGEIYLDSGEGKGVKYEIEIPLVYN